MTIYDLAELMHDKLCRGPHDADALNCPYYMENRWSTKWKSNLAWAHKEWLKKASKVEANTGMPIHQIMEVIREL